MGQYLEILRKAQAEIEAERSRDVMAADQIDEMTQAQLHGAPPADVLSAEPCPVCGSRERWQWLDERVLCRVCLILDLAPWTIQQSGLRG